MIFFDRLDDFSVCDIVVISGIRPCGRRVDLHSSGRNSHGLLYIWNGEATFRQNDGKTVKATDGQLIYIPKGLKYKMQYTGISTTFVVLNFNILSRDEAAEISKDITLLAKDSDHQIASIMAKLETSSAPQSLVGQFRRKELFYRLLRFVSVDNELLSEEAYPQQIAKGVLLLKQTYLENLPIEEFAKVSNLSTSSFRQLFGKHFGTSPLKYRNMLRIRRAKQLLEDGNCTVTEAAYDSGFENIGYFCECYKKITGETPKQTKQRFE